MPSSPPDPLDWKRSALLVHVSLLLAEDLVEYLAKMPEAAVTNSQQAANPEAFVLAHRHVTLQRIVAVIKSVQYELESFEFILRDVLVGTDGSRFVARGSKWPFDHETTHEQVLLGFQPSGTPGLINSNSSSSAIVAAGIVRTFMEAVLFRLDFESSLSGAEEVDAERWDGALDELRAAGLLMENEAMWAKKLYGVLSLVVHEGAMISPGETWVFGKLVHTLRDRLVERTATKA